MRAQLLIGAIVATTLLTLPTQAAPTDSGAVVGTVVAKGMRTNADIVVSLQAAGATVTPTPQSVQMDQKGMVFIPAVLPVVRGTTVRFLNSDAGVHNVFSPEGKYNLGNWGRGEARDYTFDKPGSYTQLCKLHPEMIATVVVVDTPYFAVTDEAGRFEIKNVPTGTYTLVTWSERLGEATQPVTVEGGKNAAVDITLSR